ncbi:MAG: alanine:cation symporter family protein, partial [Kiritimatiellae bacterium]|nr:alanine:cation symporter family protein [Kiritimatiellia bacterium]
MESVHALAGSVNTVIWTFVLVALLAGLGLWFTARTGFVQMRMLPEMFRVLARGARGGARDGGISPFQAFCVSTASRVGVGNIAGVAIAIALGGPGAVFWMWAIALAGSATGFVESTLAQVYKVPAGDGTFRGGPAFYIRNALGKPHLARVFAVLITVTFALSYNSVQANTIASALHSAFGVPLWLVAVLLSALSGVVVFGGLGRVARVAELMVPPMAGLYLLASLVVVALNVRAVPAMFATIVREAFNPSAAVAGGLGAVVINGVKRGLFSNEAGEGSVPNAAASATCAHPVEQGLVQALGVFVDTWFVCSATAFAILLSGVWTDAGGKTGVVLAQDAFASQFGAWARPALTLLVFFFAFSSIVGNYFYGEINVGFFQGARKHHFAALRAGVVGMVFFGCMASLDVVWDLADLCMGLLTLVNLYAIARLCPVAVAALRDYRARRRAGAA